jgi:hypothetical protein
MTITLTREEAQQVLKVLEYPGPSWPESRTELAVALRYKLAEPEPKPTGFIRTLVKVRADGTETWKDEPFYTAPPQREWQGLTDEDRQELAAKQYGWEGLCSAVEAKLREKNFAPNI